MKLVHQKLNIMLNINNDNMNMLVIENKNSFFTFVNDLIQSKNGEDTDIILSNDGILEIKNSVSIIFNIFDINFNNKKMVDALINYLKSIIDNEQLSNKYYDLVQKIKDFSSEVVFASDIDIYTEYEQSVKELLKLFSFRINDIDGEIIVKIEKYMEYTRKLIEEQLFIFVNLTTFLSNEKILELMKYVSYNKYMILLIENRQLDVKLDNLNLYIVDKDNCNIY